MNICYCADPWCRENGCRIFRRQQELQHDQPAFKPEIRPAPYAPMHGCVCPVGAEKTCKGAFCPRRKHKPSRKAKIDGKTSS